MHTFTMVVGFADGNTFRTEGEGRTTTVMDMLVHVHVLVNAQ